MLNENSSYKVYLACKSDLPALQQLEQSQFASDRLSLRQMRYHLTNPKALFYVCRYKEATIGYALFFLRKNRPARLYSLVIDPKHRGKGLAKSLCLEGINTLRKKKVERLLLEVDSQDMGTISFYEKLGFGPLKTIKSYYEDGRNALKMSKELL